MSGKGSEIESLLVVGVDATSVSRSASKAGFQVFGVDFFGDQDLKKYCKASSSLREKGLFHSLRRSSSEDMVRDLVKIAEEMVSEIGIDGVLLASGLEDYPGVLDELRDLSDIFGNTSEAMKRARNWEFLSRRMKRQGILFPETRLAQTSDEAKEMAKDVGYPVVLKPSKGSGGLRISLARNAKEIDENYRRNAMGNEVVLVQEFVRGINASASAIGVGDEAHVLVLTEQVIGDPRLGQNEPFAWCGNIVPLEVPEEMYRESVKSARKVVESLGLIGSNGVDFVLSDAGKPYIVEVNPRFQETIECVERYLGTNVVQNHLDACLKNEVPSDKQGKGGVWARLVLFAPETSYVENLPDDKEIRNIPPLQSIIEAGEPVCSLVVGGKDRKTSLARAYRKIEDVKRRLSTLQG